MPRASSARKNNLAIPRPLAAPAAGRWPVRNYDDPDKTIVMDWIGGLITDGHAEWGMLGNGDIELRFMTGEVFHLGETTIMRIS